MARVLHFQDGKVRQVHVDVGVSEVVVGIGLEVTVHEQQGWMNHEKGEGEMERCDTCANTFLQTFESCVYVTRMKMCEVRSERAVRRKMRATGECVYTSRRTHCCCYCMYTKPF